MEFKRLSVPDDAMLDSIARITSQPLAAHTRSAYLRFAGYSAPEIGHPITLTYDGDFTSDDLLQRFLTSDDIAKQWPYIDYLTEYAATFELRSDFFDPLSLLPLAECAAGAVYVANSGIHAGKVYHADNGNFGVSLIAPDVTRLDRVLGFTLLCPPSHTDRPTTWFLR